MVDLQYLGGCATQQTEYTPDGSEGTVTVEWIKRGENVGTTVGCVVKNDKTFRGLTDNMATEGTKYYAYTCGMARESSKAKIRIHRFTKPENKKKCTVDDVVNKKVGLVHHEYIFVPCWKFNRSSFLEEYSISVKSQTRSPLEVCEDGNVMGLCKEQPKAILKFFEFKINRQDSTSDRFCIEDSVFDKLEETGPLLIGRGKSKTLVGYYRKSSENHITISTFRTHTEEKVNVLVQQDEEAKLSPGGRQAGTVTYEVHSIKGSARVAIGDRARIEITESTSAKREDKDVCTREQAVFTDMISSDEKSQKPRNLF